MYFACSEHPIIVRSSMCKPSLAINLSKWNNIGAPIDVAALSNNHYTLRAPAMKVADMLRKSGGLSRRRKNCSRENRSEIDREGKTFHFFCNDTIGV